MHPNLSSALAIARTEVLVAMRNRVLLLVVLFAMMLVGASVGAASVAVFEQSRVILDLGLAASSMFGMLSAIILSLSAINGGLNNRTAYTLLVRPISRWAFVLGKYLGVVTTVTLLVTILWCTTTLTLWVFGGETSGAYYMSLWLLYVEVWVVAAIAHAFACLSQPVLAAVFSIGTVIAGTFSTDMLNISERLVHKGDLYHARIVNFVQLLLPNLQSLSLRSEVANALAIPGGFVLHASLYGVLYAATALSIAMWLFSQKRNF